MITHEDAEEQKLLKYYQEMKALEREIEMTRGQLSELRNLETQHMNNLDEVKKKARELSIQLFADNKAKSQSKYGDWNPAG